LPNNHYYRQNANFTIDDDSRILVDNNPETKSKGKKKRVFMMNNII
jgi:hypothetical protein